MLHLVDIAFSHCLDLLLLVFIQSILWIGIHLICFFPPGVHSSLVPAPSPCYFPSPHSDTWNPFPQ
jgi:hypothetical protein